MLLDLNPWFVVTNIGDPRLWLGLCVIFFFLRVYYKKKIAPYNKKFSWVKVFIVFAGFSMSSALGITEIFKLHFQIPRLCSPVTNIYCLDSFSFPSGHTTVAFAVFTGIYIILNKRKHLWVFALPVLVGVSRLALGVHTINDVIGGAAIGALVPLIYYLAITRIKTLEKFVYGKKT